MSDGTPLTGELNGLLSALIEGELSNDQRSRLRELLRDNAEAQQFYQRYIEVHVMLEWEAGGGSVQEPDPHLLYELLDIELKAMPKLVQAPDLTRPEPALPVERPSLKEVGQVLWHYGKHPAKWGPVAALLALSLVLFFLFSGGPQTAPIVTTGTEPDPPSSTRIVATLSGEHNAKWEEGDLSPGSTLQAGQRLSLTEGFAEITTQRGAVALLQSPCTIEFQDHPNSLRLHSGKLVGICETEASKGFVVRTPHMDVTDIGTEFGVHVDPAGLTDVAVFRGLVELHMEPAEQGSERRKISLASGQATRVLAEGALDDSVPLSTADHQDTFVRQVYGIDGQATAYDRAVLALDPISYWPMTGSQSRYEDAMGQDHYDLVPNGDEGALRLIDGPALSSSTSLSPQAMRIDGKQCFLSAGPFPSDLWEDNEYSITLWMQAAPGSAQNVVSLVPSLDERPQHYSSQVRTNESGHIVHYTFFPVTENPQERLSQRVPLTADQRVDTEQWVHVVGTYGGGRTRLYVNGKLVGEQEVGLRFETNYPMLVVGASTGSLGKPENVTQDLKGAVSGLALFNHKLDARDIEALYLTAIEMR